MAISAAEVAASKLGAGRSVVDQRAKKSRSKKKLRQPVVKLSRIGSKLIVRVGSRLKGKKQYKFTVQELRQGKCVNRGTYRTRGNGKQARTRLVVASCGSTYRARVHKTKTYRAATSKNLRFDSIPGKYSTDSNFVYYTPKCYQPSKRSYPVIVTFAPGEQSKVPGAYGGLLQGIADKHSFIVMGYKHYQNGLLRLNDFYYDDESGELEPPGPVYTQAKADIDAAFTRFRVQKSRIIFMGTSGGGSFAHALNIWYPGFADALVINTAMIWGAAASDGWNNGPDWWWFLRDRRVSTDYGDSRKQAIFLQSPTDFRYQDMLMNANLYRSKGWTVRQVEFVGGHKVAPKAIYEQEFDRLVKSAAWR